MSHFAWTHEHFDEMSWHDNHVHALRIIEGEHGAGTLEFDLDYIVEWLQDDNGRYQFKIVPSTLRFSEVTALRITLDYHRPSAALAPFSIHELKRTREERDRYTATVWNMRFNWPDGEITFESSGFSQIGRGEPVLSYEQRLHASERHSAA